MKLVELFESNDEERFNIVRHTDDEYRLPNLASILSPEYLKQIPIYGASITQFKMVTIYRGVPIDVNEIRPGDWVALSPNYAKGHEKTGHVIKKRVPAEDVAWAGTDMNEYYYVPRNLNEVKKYPLENNNNWYGNCNYKEHNGRMVMMTPDEFLSQVRPLIIDDISRENIDDLKQHILINKKLDPLVIYADGKEDGRHRAYAAKELSIKKIPVIDFRKMHETHKYP